MKHLIIVFQLLVLLVEVHRCYGRYCAEGGMVKFQPSSIDEKYVQVRITRTWDMDNTCTAGNLDDIIIDRDRKQYRCEIGECQHSWTHYYPPLRCRNFDMVDGRLMVYLDSDIYAPNAILVYISYNPGPCDLWKPLTKGGSWFRMYATANTSIRTDTGKMNHSPTPSLIPDVKFKFGCENAYVVPVIDTDNDVVRCRMAVKKNYIFDDECRQNCDSGFHIEQDSCTLSYCGTESGTFAVALQIEDFIDRTSTTPLSSVPLQFIVTVTNYGTPCDRPQLPCPITTHTSTTSTTAIPSTKTPLPVLTPTPSKETIPPNSATTTAVPAITSTIPATSTGSLATTPTVATRMTTQTKETNLTRNTTSVIPPELASQIGSTSGNMKLYIILASSLGLIVGSLITVLVRCLYAKRNRGHLKQSQNSERDIQKKMTPMQDPPIYDTLSDATRQPNLYGYSNHAQET